MCRKINRDNTSQWDKNVLKSHHSGLKPVKCLKTNRRRCLRCYFFCFCFYPTLSQDLRVRTTRLGWKLNVYLKKNFQVNFSFFYKLLLNSPSGTSRYFNLLTLNVYCRNPLIFVYIKCVLQEPPYLCLHL